jgi:hypothetical protein
MNKAITAAMAEVVTAATDWPRRHRINQWARNCGRDHASATAADQCR